MTRSARSAAVRGRLPVLAAALGRTVAAPTDDAALIAGLRDLVRGPEETWLALAVLSARLPTATTVVATVRDTELDGPAALAAACLEHTTDVSARREVEVTAATVVDVAHTSSTTISTGIQRVARETTRRWLDRDVVPVGWTAGFDALRPLSASELGRITGAVTHQAIEDPPNPESRVLVPWGGCYLVPELAAEEPRTVRLHALARYGRGRTGAIGFDQVPVTSAETTQLGFTGVFAGNLAAVRHFDAVATISEAAAVEYRGWRAMLVAAGVAGPRIVPVLLPVEAPPSSPEEVAAGRARFTVGDLPMVLVVGSHEPRKNHLAVLHAAELLWREGWEFSLTFIGGNSWGSEAFTRRLAELVAAGRPIESASRIGESLLWAAYRVARFTVFPSANEGYGLPVAESLAVGTPAITSGFGSMAEIAAGGGALTVDPHDDLDLAAAMRALLRDDTELDRLRRAALARAPRTWDDYAAEAWAALTAPAEDRAGPVPAGLTPGSAAGP